VVHDDDSNSTVGCVSQICVDVGVVSVVKSVKHLPCTPNDEFNIDRGS
jgi:hypothetical protein